MSKERVVCLVLAVFRPNEQFLKEQLRSILAQTVLPQAMVVVCSDGISGAFVRNLMSDVGLAPERLVVLEPPVPLDAVRAFEQGLVAAVDLTEGSNDAYIALSDQDDVWHPERLARGATELDRDPDVQLVHCDARVVDVNGGLVHSSMFAFEKRHRDPSLRGLLYRNSVTGMTAMFRRNLVEFALPFPPQSGVQFYHDLWLAICAASRGKIKLINSTLVDYRQHDGNAIGAVDRSAAGSRTRGFFQKTRKAVKEGSSWFRREAASYGLAKYLAHSINGRHIDRDGGGAATSTLLRPVRPYLRRFDLGFEHFADCIVLAVTGKMTLARIAAGHGIVSLGRIVWALKRALGSGLWEFLAQFDARLFDLSPGVSPDFVSQDNTNSEVPVAGYLDSRKTASWVPQFNASEPRLTILIPSLNPTEAFAGISTAVDVGLGLAARGHKIRLVATDAPVASMQTTRNFVLGRLTHDMAAAGAAKNVEFNCGVLGDGQSDNVTVPSHKDDQFLVTAWWTAHVAHKLIKKHSYSLTQMIYLIQDFEPNFYPWGSEYSGAIASYEMGAVPIFNTQLLRDYFAAKGYDFASEDSAFAFRPSINLQIYGGAREAPGKRRKLAIYGRPEVARNMFSTTLEGVMAFLDQTGVSPDEIEIVSVGLKHAPVSFPGGHKLRSLGKLPFEQYPQFLRSVDVGVSLMYSPHPSHPPLEMAAAGVRVVTNHFGPKDLSQLSGAILSVAPEPDKIAAALVRSWEAGVVSDADREVDLQRLGLHIDEMLDLLSQRLKHQSHCESIPHEP